MRRSLTVVSWNVLADSYVRPEYFPHTDAMLLVPARRREAILDRLRRTTADVLCLQEVEPALFEAAAERLDAFEGRFAQKHARPDGCALFVRKDLGAPTFRDLVFTDGTGHVALAARIGDVSIATTHLRWQPAETPPDERLGVHELEELLDAWVTPAEPWIVCGDLNAEPGSTVLATAFARGLRDAYATLPDACTANSNARRKRIDFILHTAHFDATPAPLPPVADDTPLPSPDEPSDHLAVTATLRRP